jgi:hypothetical protein
VLKLTNFIRNNANWEQKLQEKPYSLAIKRKGNFIMFNYNQIESDFYNPLVRECRGIILDEETLEIVCMGFSKFFNHGEVHADQINWNTARVQEKIDGSIIKLYNYNNEWNVSTNGTIDARDAGLEDISKYNSYYDLFMQAVDNAEFNFDTLDNNYTYIFELVSPFNRVVVPHREIKIVHTGTRNNKTLQEVNLNIGIDKPKEYGFKSIEECIRIASDLPFIEEGYVVVDNNWNRVKIKSPAYVAVHHLKNNGVVTKKRVLELILKNEQEEFLGYYPEYTEIFNEVEDKLNDFIIDMDNCIKFVDGNVIELDTRKKYAEYSNTTKCPPLMFNWLDGKINTTNDWLNIQSSEKIVEWIYN